MSGETRLYVRRCPVCCGVTDSDGVGVVCMGDSEEMTRLSLVKALDQAARDLHRAGFTGEATEARAALAPPDQPTRP